MTFYTKPMCGLCEEAQEVIERVKARRSFDLVFRNILDNLCDYELYKHDIPVILLDDREIARHRITEADLDAALDQT